MKKRNTSSAKTAAAVLVGIAATGVIFGSALGGDDSADESDYTNDTLLESVIDETDAEISAASDFIDSDIPAQADSATGDDLKSPDTHDLSDDLSDEESYVPETAAEENHITLEANPEPPASEPEIISAAEPEMTEPEPVWNEPEASEPEPVWNEPEATEPETVWSAPEATVPEPVWSDPVVTATEPIWDEPEATEPEPVWDEPLITATAHDDSSMTQELIEKLEGIAVFWAPSGDKIHLEYNCRSFKLGIAYAGTLEEAQTVREKGWCGYCAKLQSDTFTGNSKATAAVLTECYTYTDYLSGIPSRAFN